MNKKSNLINQRDIFSLLQNPFTSFAGFQALIPGLAVIIISGLVGFAGKCRFDGLLDVHFSAGVQAPIIVFLAEGLINWLTLSLLVVISARLVSKSKYRMIDVFGTQALARFPFLLIALISFLPGMVRYSMKIANTFTIAGMDKVSKPYDPYMFVAGTILSIIAIIWSVMLMYRAFAVSCNARGPKAIVYFIFVIIVGEIISKLFSGIVILLC